MRTVMAAVETALPTASPDLRDLLIVGLIEDVQIALLNGGIDLSAVVPLLGPRTSEAWTAVSDVWEGRMTPGTFNRFVRTE